jgi:hypothetical protein
MKSKDKSIIESYFRKLFGDEVSRLIRDGQYPNQYEWKIENEMFNSVVKPRLFGSADDVRELIHPNLIDEILHNVYDKYEDISTQSI